MKRVVLVLPFVAMMIGGIARAEDGNPTITDIKAQFLYEQSGTLSDDLTKRDRFASWNAIIGDGPNGENADDLLVSVVMTADKQVNSASSLSIVVRDEKNKVLARRNSDNILFEETTHQFVYIENAGCAGEITIIAKYGRQTRTEKLVLECGE